MTFKDKILEKMEWLGQELTKYWYVDITIAMVGVIIYLIAQKLKRRENPK
jgi:hypothetical protein